MASQQSQGTPSPSASSIFLPLGRRSSRASISTQAERESLNAALDQIHTEAYQSDSLTVFSDFTKPPATTSATDEKGLSGEIQGGLSGLYSRLRVSVGGVRDIVSGVGKSSDKDTIEGTATKSPGFERSTTADSRQSHPNSSQGSRLHSPITGNFQPNHDGANQSGIGKGSKPSPQAASVSLKTSTSPAPAMKSPVAPLTKATGSSAAVDPAVTELNVPAVRESIHHDTDSPNPPGSLQDMDSPGVGKEKSSLPTSLNQSTSSLGQRPSHSPVKASNNPPEEIHDAPGVNRSSTRNQLPDNSKASSSAERPMLPEIDTSSRGPSWKSKQTDGSRDGASSTHDRARTNSMNSLNHNESAVTGSEATSISRASNSGENSYYEGQTPSTLATSVSLTDGEAKSGELPKTSASNQPREKMASSAAVRSQGHTMSQAPESEETTNPAVAPLNTAVDRVPNQNMANRRPPAGNDGVISQLRSKLLSRDFWMRDENAKDCFHCGEPFSTFRRKHHCRTCGQIFDSKCTLLIPGARFGQPTSIRVCRPCEAMINAHEDDSSEFSDSEQSQIAVNPRVSELGLGSVSRASNDDDDASSVISQPSEHVMKTPTMAIPATRRAGGGHNRRSAVLEIGPDRPLTRPTSSRSLKSSLSGRAYSMGHKRHHSRQQYIRNFKPYHDDRAPFQRRQAEDMGLETRLPAFHRDNIIDPDLVQYLSDDASSGDEQPGLMSAASEGALSKSGGDNERSTFGGFLAAMKKGRSAFGDRNAASSGREADEGSISSSRAVNLPRPSRRRNLSVASSVHHRPSPRPSKDTVLNIHDNSNVSPAIPPGLSSNGSKMTRSSSMRRAGAPPAELNKASLHHVRRLLQQLLKDTDVPNAENWETALLPILLRAADDVNPDVQRGDDMDIRHYVKLKKVLGGRPGDTSYVSGLVFTKNVALKSMPRSIPNPNILIITFPLEYARHQQHFMSLEPVIRQEREFLENLVSRIAALRPNLLLVEKNVSGLALELLEDANIATAYNVKSSVLEAVSRCTQTKIITSMDKLVTSPANSQCGSFDVKTYVHDGRKKTYMYISGCPKELGCTIVLRGGDSGVLTNVKLITEFMIYVVYNLKLETCLMRDEFAKIPTSEVKNVDEAPKSGNASLMSGVSDLTSNSQQGPDEKKGGGASDAKGHATGEVTEVPDDVPMPTYYENMVHDHETKILSASPFVKFEPPYLLMRAREMERRLAYLKRLRDQDMDSDKPVDEKSKSQKFVLITPEMVHASSHGAAPKVKEVLRAAHDAEYDRALHHYQTQKRQWEGYVSGGPNLFDPYAHQNIAVLFSHVCTTTSVPCAGPDLFMLEYYNEHGGDSIFEPDCTIGQYVEDLCHGANGTCDVNGCEKPMFDHHRQYVHGEAQISIFVQPYPSKLRGLQDTILMWSCCKICGNETQVMPMSDSTWKYSFGKYLELSFWSRNLHARAGVCPHDLQRDHLRYFGFKDVALRIHYDAINLLEIFVPRTRVTWKVDKDLRLRNEVYLRTEQRLNKFMVSVKARLKGINVESVIPQRVEECTKDIDRLLKKASEEQAVLIRQLQEKYTDSRYWEVIPLNEVLRSVQEKVVEWDTIFVEFENSFFPSEKDIRRLATLQLKKIFLDRDASVTSLTSTEEQPPTPPEVEDEMPEEAEHQRPKRRMTLSPEKAKNVLVSVVEEDSGKRPKESPQDNLEPLPPPKVEEVDAGAVLLSPDEKSPSHIPLAESVTSGEAQRGEAQRIEPGVTIDQLQYRSQADTPESDRSATEASAEELEQQEKIETGESAVTHEGNLPAIPARPPPSAIPRLAEGAVRLGTGKPPLSHHQSQSPHVQQEKLHAGKPGAGHGPDGTAAPLSDSKGKPSDKKLKDRLGLGALKNGRLPGPSLIPRSVPAKRNNNSRVSNLARHFEQLSREFEKERQRERRRRAAKGTHSRAYPMASSKPIVEVYKNVREAVEEPEPVEDGEEPRTRISADDSSRGSEEFAKRASEEGRRQDHPPERPAEPMETSEEKQIFSEGEAEEPPSDEERISTDELRDSHDELGKLSPEDEAIDLKELPRHERNTLLKMLTNFWSERSASGWAPLDYPLTMSDHVFADCDIIVREDEPSSLIAFTLDSMDYKQRLEEVQRAHEKARSHAGQEQDIMSEARRVEHALLRATGTHLKYQFQEGQAKMLCKVFYAEQFDALRKKCGVADRIVESLSRCLKWDSRGGKTKSLFLKTLDDRFILKSLSTIETQAFLKFAPAYFQIMSEALFHELPSAIAKMFGFYEVIVKNPATGTEFNWYLLLMENLFYDRVPTRIFDLKGSMRNRKVQSTGERNEVLQDENMVDFIYETPLFAREHSKKLLSQSVWNDTLFLGRQNVMDYSLMIAIDESRSELVVGIIDCIRTYTWDKKLESWIKDRGFAGGGKNRPTVTSPKEYKSRFREAMARYVLQAPSCWNQFQSALAHRYGRIDQANNHVPGLDADMPDGIAE